MKIEWLVADVAADGSPDRAGHDIRGDSGRFRLIQATFVVREPLCDVRGNPLLNPNNFT